MCRQRAGCNAGTLTARSLVEAAARDMQAKGRLQPWSSKGWRPQPVVEAAARELEGFKGLKPSNSRLECLNKRRLCAGKGQAARLERWRPGASWLPRGICRQRAGCNPGAAKADGQRAWWKLPRGNWRVLGVLRVLSVWSLVTAGLNASMKDGYDKAGSTPPVVPGAAPALAKARVGGFQNDVVAGGMVSEGGWGECLRFELIVWDVKEVRIIWIDRVRREGD